MPFIDQLKHWALQQPEHPAVIAGAQTLSYGQLFQAALDAPRPAQPGVSIIDVPTGTDLVVQLCAAIIQGRTVMVLDAGWPEPLRRRLGGLARSWDEQTRVDAGPAAGTATGLVAGVDGQPFLLGLSSGTSGTPKAFLRSAASWRESFEQSSRYFSVNEATRTLAPGPLAASMNLYALGESLFAGGTFIALPQFSPDAALTALAEHHANRLVLVPAVLEMIAARGEATGAGGQELKHLVCAGSSLSAAARTLARTWAPHAVIQQYYGAAELGFVTATDVAETDGERAGAAGVGAAFPGVQLSIRDETGTQLPTGETGLVSVKSPYLCDGYAWGDDGLAFTALGDSGWSTVHDVGSLDSDGVLHLAGRASDMIITSGNNVYPHAVEQALKQGLEGADVVVAGIPDGLRGQRVIAAVLRRSSGTGGGLSPEDETQSMDAIMAVLRSNATALPAAHRPTRYFELSALPLTGSGKISRTLLAQWIAAGDTRALLDPRFQPEPKVTCAPRTPGASRA